MHTNLINPMAAAPNKEEVAAAVQQWPGPFRRSFFATINLLGQRTTAVGQLDYVSPYNFRLTVASEMGQLMFDARYNWAGCHVLRSQQHFSESVARTICRDLSMAMRDQPALAALQKRDHTMICQNSDGEGYAYTYIFAGSDGRLVHKDIQFGAIDTLHIDYPKYDARGWPQEILISRPYRAYEIELSFNGN